MNTQIAVLFDFDGVVMDTEAQYSVFWNEQGQKYLSTPNFGYAIKGQTLTQLFDKHFAGMEAARQEINEALVRFEQTMTYEYLPGIREFFADLRRNDVKMALVTSSNSQKMSNVYDRYPEFEGLFDHILTAGSFNRSKPHPECFLLGMQLLGALPENTYVFEDSFHGLQAGVSSGATVVGLATTNDRESIADKAHHIIDDFTQMNFDKLRQLQRTALRQ